MKPAAVLVLGLPCPTPKCAWPVIHSYGRTESPALTASQCSSLVCCSPPPLHLSTEAFELASHQLHCDCAQCFSHSETGSATSYRLMFKFFYSLCGLQFSLQFLLGSKGLTSFLLVFSRMLYSSIWAVSLREAVYSAAYCSASSQTPILLF